MSSYNITIPNINKTIVLTQAVITVRLLALFNSAVIDVRLLDANGIQWESLTFQMSYSEYTNWTNDQYLIEWVLNKINNSS